MPSRYTDHLNAINNSDQTISFEDAAVDSFGRLRVSTPLTLLDSKQLNDNLPLLWDEVAGGGASSSSHSSTNSASTMSVGGSGEYVIRQTKMRCNYQPGKSLQSLFTFVLGAGVTGVTKRVGYFNSSTSAPYTANLDGIYLEQDGTTLNIVQSKNGTATTIPQSSWNTDKLDGTGDSGITLDVTKSQILFIDFEWLGVGRVRVGFVINGVFYTAHVFNNSNSLDSVYMSSPNHSCRYEIRSTSGSGTLEHICSTVSSEGGLDDLGVLRYISTGGTHIDANTENTLYALLGLRLKANYLDVIVKLIKTSLQIQTSSEMGEWQLLWNPTVADTFTYSDISNSACQSAVGTTANTVTGGVVIDGGFIQSSSTGQGNGGESSDLENALKLGSQIDGTRDEVVLCIRPIGGATNIDIEAALSWRELL